VKGVRGLIEAEAAKSGAIRRIHTIRTMHLGPQDVLATVRIDFEDTVSAARVEGIVGDLERAIKARFPEIRHLLMAAKGEWPHGEFGSRPGMLTGPPRRCK
jgi:divalent metal cation (Fe/Co/Zn/Cd) transporter